MKQICECHCGVGNGIVSRAMHLRVVVFETEDGLVLVDAGMAAAGPVIRELIASVTDARERVLETDICDGEPHRGLGLVRSPGDRGPALCMGACAAAAD